LNEKQTVMSPVEHLAGNSCSSTSLAKNRDVTAVKVGDPVIDFL
jgi:hypothetical protein